VGLHFNQWVLNETITSGAPTNVNTLVPWPGDAPEEHFAGIITYTGPAGVPEPAAWALMILGLGGLGVRLRAAGPWRPEHQNRRTSFVNRPKAKLRSGVPFLARHSQAVRSVRQHGTTGLGCELRVWTS
jgi:hypothetical protein